MWFNIHIYLVSLFICVLLFEHVILLPLIFTKSFWMNLLPNTILHLSKATNGLELEIESIENIIIHIHHREKPHLVLDMQHYMLQVHVLQALDNL